MPAQGNKAVLTTFQFLVNCCVKMDRLPIELKWEFMTYLSLGDMIRLIMLNKSWKYFVISSPCNYFWFTKLERDGPLWMDMHNHWRHAGKIDFSKCRLLPFVRDVYNTVGP